MVNGGIERSRHYHLCMMTGKTDPNEWEGSHDPELSGSENVPMRSKHFADEVSKYFEGYTPLKWPDDPFAGIPQADDEPF